LTRQPVQHLDHLERPKLTLGTIAGASRVWQSTTVSNRKERPSKSPSDMKSITHTSFGAAAAERPIRTRQARRRRGSRGRIAKPSSQ